MRPRISDRQFDLLEQRSAAAGVDRRTFVKIAAALAALGPAGFNARPASAQPKLAPGEKLAKDQTLRLGGGGWWQNDPSSHDYNKDLYCSGVPALWAGLMKCTVNFEPVPYVASKVASNADGSVWTFTIRKDSKWSDGSPCTARDFEYSWKRQLDPGHRRPVLLVPLRHQERRGLQQEAGHRSRPGRRARQGRLDAGGDPGGAPRLLPGAGRLPGRAARPHARRSRSSATSGRRPATSSRNGPFVLEAWEHNKVMVLRRNKHFFGAKDMTLDKVVIPIIPLASGSLPYENNELDLTALQTADLKRLQGDRPARARKSSAIRIPAPGTCFPR